MNGLFGKFIDGGPVFTVPIFILLLVVIGLFIWGFLKHENQEKAVSLLNHIGWFAVAWGFMGRTFGLIMAFDMVEATGELTPHLLAEGLKMALVDPLFGIFVFVVARTGIIVLIAMRKKNSKTSIK